MKKPEFEQMYKELGIPFETPDPNYNPEIYGKKLMYGSRSFNEISYSDSTAFSLGSTLKRDK